MQVSSVQTNPDLFSSRLNGFFREKFILHQKNVGSENSESEKLAPSREYSKYIEKSSENFFKYQEMSNNDRLFQKLNSRLPNFNFYGPQKDVASLKPDEKAQEKVSENDEFGKGGLKEKIKGRYENSKIQTQDAEQSDVYGKIKEDFNSLLKMFGFSEKDAEMFSKEIANALKNQEGIDELNISLSSLNAANIQTTKALYNGDTGDYFETSKTVSALHMQSLEISIDLNEGSIQLRHEDLKMININVTQTSAKIEQSDIKDILSSYMDFIEGFQNDEKKQLSAEDIEEMIFKTWLKLSDDAVFEENLINEKEDQGSKTEIKDAPEKKDDKINEWEKLKLQFKSKYTPNKFKSMIKLKDVIHDKNLNGNDMVKIKLDMLTPVDVSKSSDTQDSGEAKKEKTEHFNVEA